MSNSWLNCNFRNEYALYELLEQASEEAGEAHRNVDKNIHYKNLECVRHQTVNYTENARNSKFAYN